MMRTFSEAIVAIGSSAELLVVVKATVALLLGLAAVRMAQHGRASVRHLLLISTFGALLALPVAVALVPSVGLKIPTTHVDDPTASPAMAVDNQITTARSGRIVEPLVATNGDWISKSRHVLLQSAWAIGATLFLAFLARALWRLRCVRRSGVPWLETRVMLRTLADEAGVRKPVDVLIHEDIVAPLTCGLLRPAILLPADAREWSEPDLRRAFVHELEHIRRFDWTVHIMTRSICALYWFHPLVWVTWRQLCLEAERACDDAVLLGAERADYAEQLVVLARRLSSTVAPPALSMANRSDLSTRVSAILDSSQPRGRARLLHAAVALTVTTVVVLAIAPVRAVRSSPNANGAISTQQTAPPKPSRLSRALLDASEAGDIADMTRLLDSGAEVNSVFEGDGSPLIVAAREGHKAAVQLLLDRGADPDLAVPGDGNAIIMAAREGHEDVVRLLLDRGASINRVVPGDENALIQASGTGQLPVVKLLISRSADVNARVWAASARDGSKGEWRTPLSMARKGGHSVVVDFLLSMGARE